MGMISKVVSIPAATQYNPTSAPAFALGSDFSFGTEFSYGQVFNGQTPTMQVHWQEPTPSFFKNKASSSYRFRLTKDSDGSLVRDALLGPYLTEGSFNLTSLGSGLIAGQLYKIEIYTTANGGTTLYNATPKYFIAQTAPNLSPRMDSPFGGYTVGGFANSPSGNTVDVTITQHTSDWGGLSTSQIGRYYAMDLVLANGTTAYSTNISIVGGGDPAYSSTTPLTVRGSFLSGIDNDNYRIFLKAGTRGGTATRVENSLTQQNGPQNFPPYNTPTLTSISPISGSTAGGTSVLIQGTYLRKPTSVSICGINATVVDSGYNFIVATTGSSPNSVVGNVVVTNPAGSATLVNAYTYISGPPPPPPFFPPYFGPIIY